MTDTPKPAPATPAATPMAVDPSAGQRSLPAAWNRINGGRVDAEAIAKWFFRVDDPRQRECELLVQAAIDDAVAMNSEAPQKLPAAAQPQRESDK